MGRIPAPRGVVDRDPGIRTGTLVVRDRRVADGERTIDREDRASGVRAIGGADSAEDLASVEPMRDRVRSQGRVPDDDGPSIAEDRPAESSTAPTRGV